MSSMPSYASQSSKTQSVHHPSDTAIADHYVISIGFTESCQTVLKKTQDHKGAVPVDATISWAWYKPKGQTATASEEVEKARAAQSIQDAFEAVSKAVTFIQIDPSCEDIVDPIKTALMAKLRDGSEFKSDSALVSVVSASDWIKSIEQPDRDSKDWVLFDKGPVAPEKQSYTDVARWGKNSATSDIERAHADSLSNEAPIEVYISQVHYDGLTRPPADSDGAQKRSENAPDSQAGIGLSGDDASLLTENPGQ